MIRYILKSINLLNLVLAGLIAIFLRYALMPPVSAVVKAPVPVKQAVSVEAEDQEDQEEPALSPLDYIIIAEQNVFHPERKIPVEKKEEKPLPLPEFVLYGTLIEGEKKIAFMDDLKAQTSSPGRGKRQRVVTAGGSLSGFILKDVLADKVVMVRGEEKIEVRLEAGKNKRAADSGVTSAPPKQPAAQPAQPQAQGSQDQQSPLRRTFRSTRGR